VGVSFDLPRSFLGDLRLSADRRMRTLGDTETTSDEAQAIWDLPFRGRFTSRIRGGLIRHQDQVATALNKTSSFDFGWVASRTVRIDGGASVYEWSRDGSSAEQYINVNASVSWDWGLFTTRLQGHHNVRRNGVRLETTRWDLHVTRVF
jgi:hypothetical protein